ncbi:hypothetical protein [Priestia megaterium]|uniref:hypothetical protein n=1 Tax=Priestia megaterium TaxID=1404 RepID=UPI0013630452|nr:hypothetical protein [Priestia megaterium]
MSFNIERTLIIMELILQDVLKTNFVIPLYPTTFREIFIPVPTPPGVTNLPPNIYFDLDNRFNLAQEQEIRDAIGGLLFHWSIHMGQKWNGGTNDGISQMASCNNTYATRNLRPAWYIGTPIPNGLVATNVAMDQFTQLIRDNGFHLAPRAKIFSNIPFPTTSSLIYGLTSSKKANVPLSFIINPAQLDNPQIGIGILIGSMFHAWLHRAGFFHPNTTSYFITECPMCVMRGYQPKNAIPDSAFYQFFD